MPYRPPTHNRQLALGPAVRGFEVGPAGSSAGKPPPRRSFRARGHGKQQTGSAVLVRRRRRNWPRVALRPKRHQSGSRPALRRRARDLSASRHGVDVRTPDLRVLGRRPGDRRPVVADGPLVGGVKERTTSRRPGSSCETRVVSVSSTGRWQRHTTSGSGTPRLAPRMFSCSARSGQTTSSDRSRATRSSISTGVARETET